LTFDSSASTYVFSAVKAVFRIVPAPVGVVTTSTGMVTSDAPLSTVKSSVIALLMVTGTAHVPRLFFVSVDDMEALR